jgi:hypothetical protein
MVLGLARSFAGGMSANAGKIERLTPMGNMSSINDLPEHGKFKTLLSCLISRTAPNPMLYA